MWQEDLTAEVARALGRRDVVLVRVPAHQGADWAVMLRPSEDPAALDRIPGIEHLHLDADRAFLTLTDACRGQVVLAVLTGTAPRGEQVRLVDARARRTAEGLPDRPLPDRLYPTRLAHARTAMLLRQAQGHRVLPAGVEAAAALARDWAAFGHTRREDGRSRRLLLALAGSHVARVRARSQRRGAPVVANLREVTAAFTDWFGHMRATPRGSPPPPEDPIMDTYRLNLALAHATGSVLRTGLHHLGLTAPEYL